MLAAHHAHVRPVCQVSVCACDVAVAVNVHYWCRPLTPTPPPSPPMQVLAPRQTLSSSGLVPAARVNLSWAGNGPLVSGVGQYLLPELLDSFGSVFVLPGEAASGGVDANVSAGAGTGAGTPAALPAFPTGAAVAPGASDKRQRLHADGRSRQSGSGNSRSRAKAEAKASKLFKLLKL